MTASPYIGWKFGADIKQADGHFLPQTCYVAVSDHDSARRELADRHPDVAFHAARGEGITKAEWERVFAATPSDGEVRCA